MTTTRNTVSEPVPFEASDFLDLDRLLSDEERTVREEVNGSVREKIKPYVRDWWEKAIFPREIVPEMEAQGLLGVHLEGYGCAGKSAVSYGLACMELEAGDWGLRTYEGTDEVHTLVLGQAITGIPAFR